MPHSSSRISRVSSPRRFLLLAAGSLLLSALLAWGLWAGCRFMWAPEWVRWTRNAYAMTQADVWTGWDAMRASFSHWFIAFYGRTVVTMLMGVLWVVCTAGLMYWSFNCAQRQQVRQAA